MSELFRSNGLSPFGQSVLRVCSLPKRSKVKWVYCPVRLRSAQRPKWPSCELEIKGIPGLKYDGVFEFPLLYEDASWHTNETPGNEVASLRWAVLPVRGQQHLRFQIAVLRDFTTDWGRVSQGATLRCYYRKEKLRGGS